MPTIADHPDAMKALTEYPAKSGCILYRDGSGVLKTWVVGADPAQDDEASLREHLRRSLPAAEFVGFAIK